MLMAVVTMVYGNPLLAREAVTAEVLNVKVFLNIVSEVFVPAHLVGKLDGEVSGEVVVVLNGTTTGKVTEGPYANEFPVFFNEADFQRGHNRLQVIPRFQGSSCVAFDSELL